MTEDNSILSATCKEPTGEVQRYVYGPLPLTRENLDRLWKKFRRFKTIFSQDINDDFNKFVNLFVGQDGDTLRGNGLVWVIDDFVGVYYLTDIVQQGDILLDANVHYTFFDCKYSGRYGITKKMIKYVFDKYQFHRLSVELPHYTEALIEDRNNPGQYIKRDATKDFVEAIGFRYEGEKRSAIQHNDRWYDVRLYGMVNPNYLRSNVTTIEPSPKTEEIANGQQLD